MKGSTNTLITTALCILIIIHYSEESQANSLNKKTDGESMTGDNGNNLFVRVLNNVFEKCKLIMSNHHTVCMAFEKFQQPPKHRLKAILEGTAK